MSLTYGHRPAEAMVAMLEATDRATIATFWRRQDLGFIALVEPTSQIVGTQAVLNMLGGERYKNITKEAEGVLRGEYGKINPLIGGAGVSAVPMAARVANRIGTEANPHNFLLMHAMGPNVAGVIGSAVAAGVLIQIVG